jgi:hypothetical protein
VTLVSRRYICHCPSRAIRGTEFAVIYIPPGILGSVSVARTTSVPQSGSTCITGAVPVLVSFGPITRSVSGGTIDAVKRGALFEVSVNVILRGPVAEAGATVEAIFGALNGRPVVEESTRLFVPVVIVTALFPVRRLDSENFPKVSVIIGVGLMRVTHSPWRTRNKCIGSVAIGSSNVPESVPPVDTERMLGTGA